VDREPHHIIETSGYATYGGSTYPFLNAVCPGLVERPVAVNIIIYFGIRQLGKLYFRLGTERLTSLRRPHGDTGHHRLHPPRQPAQHGPGIFFVARLAQHFSVEYHHRVGRNYKTSVLLRERKSVGFKTRQIGRHLSGRHTFRHFLVDWMRRVDRKTQVKQPEQFLSAWRAACKHHAEPVKIFKWMKHIFINFHANITLNSLFHIIHTNTPVYTLLLNIVTYLTFDAKIAHFSQNYTLYLDISLENFTFLLIFLVFYIFYSLLCIHRSTTHYKWWIAHISAHREHIVITPIINIHQKIKSMKRIRMLLTASFTAFCLLSGGVNSLVAQTVTARGTEDSKISVYRGVVIDDEGDPLPGVSITIVGKKGLGTATNVDGEFSIRYDQPKCVIQFSYVGMKTQQVRATAGKRMTVQLETDAQVIGEAVANGIYTRNIESFTGSVSTFNSDDLKMISANNILKSLSALDPSIIMPENTLMGSDPNTMPKLTINGEMNPQALAQEYETDPNQPLFILDGFESTLQAINDLNMDRIESISILKDASATAIYGSKAANGVIVVETKKPEAGRLQLSYNGSLQFAWADLSDYNLMNSEQKLQFELLAGRFGNLDDNGLPVSEVDRNSYFDRRRLIDMGHETYWMNEPLRTAVTQTHNLYIQGGDQSFRFGAGLSYSKNEGVMKDSNRDVINGNVNLTYRVDNFSFTNQTTINHVGSTNETVPFSRFSAMSPFYPKYDEATGLPPKYVFYDTSSSNPYEWNPIWDMNQNSFKKGDITTITDNFQFEWRVSRQLRLRGNLQYQLQKTTNETYTSPNETSMHSVASDKKGSYTNSNSTANSYSGRLNATYGTAIGLHTINAVGGMQISERNNRSYSFGAAGYSSDTFWNPNFSNGYPENGKPTSTDSKTRNVSYYANGNYAYDMKYLLDFNWTLSGASQFGIDDHFTPTWSVGIGWNIHNESWFKTSSLINYLKVRASYGNPGNQNYDAKLAASIYKFMTEYTNPFGLSNIIEQWGNNGLKWQKTNTYNVGLTATMFDNRLSLNADYQIRKTDPQLVRIDLPGSTGVTSAPINVGGTDNRSISLSATCYIIKKYNFNWYVSGNLNHYTTTYFGIGDVLQQYNEAGRISSSLARMYDGGSISGLYAVRSLGIDPATGNEMLLKKNGTPTYEWNAEDEVLVGDSNPDIQGNFSTSFLYKGFTFGASFSFKMGGDVTLNTLMDKIENISGDALRKNQDVRALTDRWKKPGDIAKYKRIDDTSTSHITTRFIKTENTFSCGSINIGYRTATAKFLNTIGATSFDIRFYMNDIFRISNIKEERGLSYPFQRSCSMSLGLSF